MIIRPSALLALAGILAIAFAIIVPPFQVPDEHAHFLRAYQISQGHFVGKENFSVPAEIASIIKRYPETLGDDHKVRFANVITEIQGRWEISSMVALPPDDLDHKYLHWGIVGANLYSPIVYLPAGAGIAIGRWVGVSPLGTFYAARLSNVLSFLALLTVAFILAPDYRNLFGALALMPMTLHEAGGVSADAVTIGVAFVGASCVLWLRQNRASRLALALIALTFAVWVLCKSSPWAAVAVLLIPRERFSSRRSWISYLCTVWAGMAASMWIWQSLSAENLKSFIVARSMSRIDLAANTRLIVTHPIAFVQAMMEFSGKNWFTYIGQFSATFGWLKLGLTRWVRYPYLVMLLVAASSERLSKGFSTRERAILLSVFLAGFAFLHAALFVSDGSMCGADLCFTASAGIQGRYFIPFAPFALLALRQRRFTLPSTTLTMAIAIAAVIFGAASLRVIWSSYYM